MEYQPRKHVNRGKPGELDHMVLAYLLRIGLYQSLRSAEYLFCQIPGFLPSNPVASGIGLPYVIDSLLRSDIWYLYTDMICLSGEMILSWILRDNHWRPWSNQSPVVATRT